jgi:hypothetical protein
LITSGVCAFYSLSDDNDLVPFIILLGDFFTAGSCVIGHFIKWHQTLLTQPLMVLLEWSVAVFLQ